MKNVKKLLQGFRINHRVVLWSIGAFVCFVAATWFAGAKLRSLDNDPVSEVRGSDPRRADYRNRQSEHVSGVSGTIEQMARDRRSNPKGLDFYLKRWQDKLRASDSDFGGLATSMVLEGYGTEALQLARESVAPGKNRRKLIYAIFRAADPMEATHLFALLDYGDEKEAACEGIAQVLAFSDAPATLNLDALGYLGEWRDRFLGAFAVKYFLQQRRGSEDDAKEAFRSVFIDLPLSHGEARRVLLETRGFLPFETWAHMDSAGNTLSGTERQWIMDGMFQDDAAKAMDVLAAGGGREADMEAGFKLWMELDSMKPIIWLQARSADLNVAQKDYAAKAIAEYSASHGEWDVAWKWVEQIGDTDLRKRAEEHLWTMERDILK